MATDVSEPRIRPAAVSTPARGSWPVGRWMLDRRGAGLVRVLILVPTVALVRRSSLGGLRPFFETLATPEVRRAFGLSLGNHRAGHGGQHDLRDRRGARVGSAAVLGPCPAGRRGRPAVRRLADRRGLDVVVLYGPEGWLGRWLEPHGVRVVYALPGMILATLFVTVPFVVRELVPVLRELGEEHEQAAYTLGPVVGGRSGA